MHKSHKFEIKTNVKFSNLLEIEKAESKYRRAHEEYKTSVSSYGNAREDFERKMTIATKRFQVT